jgi:hypothetical protein
MVWVLANPLRFIIFYPCLSKHRPTPGYSMIHGICGCCNSAQTQQASAAVSALFDTNGYHSLLYFSMK